MINEHMLIITINRVLDSLTLIAVSLYFLTWYCYFHRSERKHTEENKTKIVQKYTTTILIIITCITLVKCFIYFIFGGICE